MPSSAQLFGWTALLMGFLASSIAAGFIYQNGGFTIGTGGDPLESGTRLFSYIALALLFEFGMPALCVAAFFFGVPARDLWSARVGMVLAVSAATSYLLFLRACYRMIVGP